MFGKGRSWHGVTQEVTTGTDRGFDLFLLWMTVFEPCMLGLASLKVNLGLAFDVW